MRWRRFGRPIAATLVVCGVLGLTTACGAAGGDTDPAALEGTWRLVSYADADGSLVDVEDGVDSEFTLDGETASGVGGVNTFDGSYEAGDDGSISFGPLAATLMAGEAAAMEQEAGFFAALADAAVFSAVDSTLTLKNSDDETVAVLEAD